MRALCQVIAAALILGVISFDFQARSQTAPVIPPSGVSALQFPLVPGPATATLGVSIDVAPPPIPSQSQSAATQPRRAAKSSSNAVKVSQLGPTDLLGCSTNGDTPPQEIDDLAAALKNDWRLIFRFVHNNILTEPGAESSKGALGTYTDRSGASFDQATLLVSLLRAAGYQANFVVGSKTFAAQDLGLRGLPNQLIVDAGGSSNGSMPYAWVQVNISNTWISLDPAAKSYATVPGQNWQQWVVNQPPAYYQQNYIDGTMLNAGNLYNNVPSLDYADFQTLVGGRFVLADFTDPPPSGPSGGTV